MEEIWKDVIGTSGRYQVSNTGKVRSVPQQFEKHRTGPKLGKELKPKVDKYGYLSVCLYMGAGERHTCKVHRLVLTAFTDNPMGKPEVNHIDGVKTHNSVDNLEWVTSSENKIHAIKTGLFNPHQYIYSDKCPQPKITMKYDCNGNLLKIYKSINEAAREERIDKTCLRDAISGKQKYCKGCVWKTV